MPSFFVRIRLSADVLSNVFDRISSTTTKTVVYQHADNPDNVHCHLLLIDCNVSTDTLKNYIKATGEVPVRAGNKFWSFKTCDSDLDTPVVYMSKGRLSPSYVKGFTQEQLDSYKDRWVDRTPETSGSKTLVSYTVKENPEQQKRRQWDNVQEIVKRYNLLQIKTGRELCRIIKKVVIDEGHTMLGRYKLRDYYDTVKAIVQENDWSLTATQFCEKDYF